MGGAHNFTDVHGESRRLLLVIDGRVKLCLLLAAVVVNLTAGGTRLPLALFAAAMVLTLSAGVRPGAFAKRMLVPAMLAVVAFVTQLFWVKQGDPLLSFPLFDWQLTMYQAGIARGLELAARIIGGMGVLLFFSLTTPLPELMRAAKFFRCPPVLVELALIMYRYIFLLFEEAERIRNAQRARLGFVSARTALRSAGILGGMLVLRTFDRAERSFAAMRCRGYQGAPTSVPPKAMLTRDWVVLALGVLLLGALWLLR